MPNLILDRGPCPRKSREGEFAAPSMGVAGVFDVELLDARSGLVKGQWSFPNVITTAGLDALISSGSLTLDGMLTWAAVGTNNTAPAIADTALGAQAGVRVSANAGIADASGNSLVSPEHWWFRRTREWGTAQGNGNLTEIGLFSADTGGVMWCRALFRDGSNNPITITKTSADILRVTYEVRFYPALGDASQSALNISGTNYNITWRPVHAGLWTLQGWASTLQSIVVAAQHFLSTAATQFTRLETTPNWATTLNASSASQSGWNSSTRVVSRTATWEPAAGAITAPSVMIAPMRDAFSTPWRCPYQGLFSPPLGKTGTNRLVLNYTIGFDRVVV
jgi:hypothetical protein